MRFDTQQIIDNTGSNIVVRVRVSVVVMDLYYDFILHRYRAISDIVRIPYLCNLQSRIIRGSLLQCLSSL